MISQGEFVRRMDVIKQFLEDQEELRLLLSKIAGENVCCGFGAVFLEKYIDQLSECVGDQPRWIDWYVWDNEMGTRRHPAVINGKEYVISNVKKLYKIITMDRRDNDN